MSASHKVETTFKSFTKDQGANYAAHRSPYDTKVYDLIIQHHTATGGHLTTLVDVGCGPGGATRELAKHFASAIGLDASEGMIATAQSLLTDDQTSKKITFRVGGAEDLPGIEAGSVDLLTAATAAHWFDMPRFWASAARVLKPGGTVAIWCVCGSRIDPAKTPNGAAIQAFGEKFDDEVLGPFQEPGSKHPRSYYRDLVLPWSTAVTEKSVVDDAFDEKTFYRKEWKGETDGDYLVQLPTLTLDVSEKILSTASSIIRWRDAHPDKVGTEEDVLKVWRRGVEELLYEAGVEKGKELINGGVGGVLLMVKRT
ncbi:methyltransferase [Podospora didyma]|uniref:Methyltransferase n=1 Tax=Podospora didyma TaxID=330526 RepID=A0AAE0P8K0_9PEZI|nr:methyltransferase [Podospora didyma]